MKLLIVGNRGGTNIGGSFERAAKELDLETHIIESSLAMHTFMLLKKFIWHFKGHRPGRLGQFSKNLVKLAKEGYFNCLLSVGFAPIKDWALAEFGKVKIKRINYLTDDPWNRSQISRWFFKALPFYNSVFTTRRANINDLTGIGCNNVRYLPFAYDPALFYPEHPTNITEREYCNSDVVFFGGADQDRVPYIAALIHAGFKVGLYGSYWERFRETRKYSQGQVSPKTLRLAISSAKVALCLVRRANRDGHSMRSFEIPAIGACMLTEDTYEHRELFGKEGKAVLYFRTIDDMVKKLKFLLKNDTERKRLAKNAHELIVNSNHTYKDRLLAMLNEVKS